MAKEYTPFKMKGSPMQRNFGVSPMKQGPALGSFTRSSEKSDKKYEHTVESRIKDLIERFKAWRSKRNK